ncbi:MAG: hypothetical protein CMK00_09025 [Planctomycetes bacterium]|jgi:hypothetical protein|nr:hypothetical protein [Planctomycetota bacterium]HJO25673.1 hypothetical protein [Planctomycetota bacterium]
MKRPISITSRALVGFLVLGTSASRAAASIPGDDELPHNAPTACTICGGEAEAMAAGGIVSHGPFDFGETDSQEVDKTLGSARIIWIETAHFEIGMALGPYKIPTAEKEKLRGELERLALVYPEIKPKKVRVIDVWLRAHLYAMRSEDTWNRMLEVLQVEESDFPPKETTWLIGTPYWGQGPYIGQVGKYETLILPSEALSLKFLSHYFGLMIRRSQRWNVIARDTLTLTMHSQQGGLRAEPALHGHLVFNLTHNLVDGFKHYTYETPIWLHEGLAHYMEREIDPRFNTFDSSEGAASEKTRKARWKPEVRKLVAADEAPRLAELLRIRSYGDLTLEGHYATWSMIDFLLSEHPDFIGQLLGAIKGIVRDGKFGDATLIPEIHREVFKQRLGMTYARFDAAWGAWVIENYPAR